MIKEPNMSVEQPHSLGAVLKGAILLIFFVFGVTTYAQSYNAPISYRVSGTTQSTASAEQWNGGVYDGVGSCVSESGYRVSDNTYRVPNQAYRAFDDGYQVSNVTYNAYQGAVYEPFSNTVPSEGGNGSRGISGRRNSWSGPGMGEGNGGEEGDDPGQRDEANEPVQPIGEPLVLLLFAALAAIFVARRQRQAA